MLTTIEASPTKAKRPFSLEEVVRRQLKAGGWKPERGKGGTIWRNPNDRYWYDELRAIALLKEGVDPGCGA